MHDRGIKTPLFSAVYSRRGVGGGQVRKALLTGEGDGGGRPGRQGGQGGQGGQENMFMFMFMFKCFYKFKIMWINFISDKLR